jgi:hypothetical protein
MVAEVIASAFASGLSWKGTLAGTDVYCPPQGLKGDQVMTALDQFLASNPNFADKTYGDALAMSLSRAFPCQDNKPARRFKWRQGADAHKARFRENGAKSDLVTGRIDSRP